jgi:hypothetical protein
VKIHCSVLAEDAIKAAIQDYKKKNDQAPAEGEQAASAQEAGYQSSSTKA